VQAVVREQDRDFGRVLAVPGDHDCLPPSQKIDVNSLSHLTEEQQEQLLHVLDAFSVCFLDKPGFCHLVEQEIITVEGFKPKQLEAYKVPDMLKTEVDRQLKVLLEDGFIQPSKSPMTSPMVCVLKPDKTGLGKQEVRLVID
jgi:hypothetical protein